MFTCLSRPGWRRSCQILPGGHTYFITLSYWAAEESLKGNRRLHWGTNRARVGERPEADQRARRHNLVLICTREEEVQGEIMVGELGWFTREGIKRGGAKGQSRDESQTELNAETRRSAEKRREELLSGNLGESLRSGVKSSPSAGKPGKSSAESAEAQRGEESRDRPCEHLKRVLHGRGQHTFGFASHWR